MDKLLEILSENSSFNSKELAMMLGVSEETINNKIKEYEKSGAIKGYHAIVDWEKVPDAGVTALIELKVTPQKETGFDLIAERVSKFDEVTSLYLMAGGYDLGVVVKGKTMQEVASFVARKLSCIDGVLSTATHFMLKTYKDSGVSLIDTDLKKDERSMVL